LSGAEYIINEVRRHNIGLIAPVGIASFFVLLIVSFIISYPSLMNAVGIMSPPAYGVLATVAGLIGLLFVIGGYVTTWIYSNNKFFPTNESVIQEIQTNLFARREQTVSLANIEDASFQQKGMMQIVFNYGSIRLSTEGDETSYRFDYVSNLKQQIAILNNAVEAF
jgi:hypothetical protein